MPLVSIAGSDAVRIRKGNPAALWGNRSAPNRVEPIARPTFDAPFKLKPGESVFTIGSCFARHMELELEARGFNLPFCDLLKTPAFAGVDRGLLNNYGTPSIYNELRWALEPESCDVEEQLVELGNGKYVPFHYRMKPDSKDAVIGRLQCLRDAYRKVRECRVVIMTLGLVEVWFDTMSSCYLNLMPLPSLLKQDPDRFQLHTLSFDETYRFLDDALQLLKKHGRSDVQVILTVSPVPMQATHRPMDVLVANTYSKSVLRTAAETAVTRYDFITYFPSYECFVLSDRHKAWQDDLVHPTTEMIAFNVARMLDAYLNANDDLDAAAAEIEAGGMLVATQKAASASLRDEHYAERFFSRFGRLSCQSAEFAREHAGFVAKENPRAAAQILADAPGQDIETLILRGRMLIGSRQFSEAIALLTPHATRGAYAVWTVLLDAYLGSDDYASVPGVLARYVKALPSQGRTAVFMAAEDRKKKGLKEQAAVLYFAAAHLLPNKPGVQRIANEFLRKEAPALADQLQTSAAPMTRAEVRQLLMQRAVNI